jgi:choline-glycine betaine transporter
MARDLSHKLNINNVDTCTAPILTNDDIGVKEILVLDATVIAGLLVLLSLVPTFDLNVSILEVLTLFAGMAFVLLCSSAVLALLVNTGVHKGFLNISRLLTISAFIVLLFVALIDVVDNELVFFSRQ